MHWLKSNLLERVFMQHAKIQGYTWETKNMKGHNAKTLAIILSDIVIIVRRW